MPRGRKPSTDKSNKNVITYIVRDTSKPQEGKIPNFIFEDILGIYILDTRSLEIVKLKNVKVTEDNIASVSKVYGEKYKIGDEYQEWGNYYGVNGYYPSTLSYALISIKNMIIASGISKLKEETNLEKALQIIEDANDKILECLKTEIIPKSGDLASKLIKDMQKSTTKIEEVEKACEEALLNCNELNEMIKERKRQITNDMVERHNKKGKK